MSLLFPPAPVRLAVFAAAAATIAWLSLSPTESLPQGLTFWDKAEHACAYLGLALIGAWTFPGHLLRVAGGLFAAGIGVEILQSVMGMGRQGDPMDALANTVGILLGMTLAVIIGRLHRARVR
jgi:VanZ family protein